MSMTLLIRHDDVAFEDDTVMVTGHFYFRCRFVRCTLILMSGLSAGVRA